MIGSMQIFKPTDIFQGEHYLGLTFESNSARHVTNRAKLRMLIDSKM